MRVESRLLMCVMPLTWGCYTYQPVDWAEVSPSMEVRARVSLAEAERLSTVLPYDGRLVEGQVVENGAASLLLRVPVADAAAAGMGRTLYQQITLPREGVLEVELKELHRTRTAAAVTAVAALGVAILYTIIDSRAGGSSPNPPPGPVETLIPIGR